MYGERVFKCTGNRGKSCDGRKLTRTLGLRCVRRTVVNLGDLMIKKLLHVAGW